MGDLVRIDDRSDNAPVAPGHDVLDAPERWVAHARATGLRQPMTAILILEDADGALWWASDSRLQRCDLARLVGLTDMAKAHMRSNSHRLIEPEAP